MPAPSSNIEVGQHLTKDQLAAVRTGNSPEGDVDTAAGNYLKSFDTPHQALEHLSASGGENRKNAAEDLEKKGASRSTADNKKLDLLNRQLQGDELVRGAIRTRYENNWQSFMQGLKNKPADEAVNDLSRLSQQLADARSAVTAAKTPDETVAAEKTRDYLDQRHREATRIVQPLAERERANQTATARAERDKKVNDQNTELEAFDIDTLREEDASLKQQEIDLAADIAAATTAGDTTEVERLNKDLEWIKWRKAVAEKIATRKLEAEAKTASSDIDKDEDTSNIRNLNSVQLNAEIVDRRAKVEATRGRIQTASEDLADPATYPARRKELLKIIHDEKAKLGPDTEVLKLYEDAQYQSDMDFRNASSDDRAEALLRIKQEGDLMPLGDFDQLKRKLLESGEPMTKEEIASLGQQLTGKFLENGIQTWTNAEGIKLGDLRQIFAARPELQKFFSARLSEDKASRALLDEHAPNWKKLIKNPKWLLILLAIVAGLTVATVAVPAVAAIGKGAGAAKGLL